MKQQGEANGHAFHGVSHDRSPPGIGGADAPEAAAQLATAVAPVAVKPTRAQLQVYRQQLARVPPPAATASARRFNAHYPDTRWIEETCASSFSGTTAEFNNLNLSGSCVTNGSTISFVESGGVPVPTTPPDPLRPDAQRLRQALRAAAALSAPAERSLGSGRTLLFPNLLAGTLAAVLKVTDPLRQCRRRLGMGECIEQRLRLDRT